MTNFKSPILDSRFSNAMNDLRFAFRQLLKNPGFGRSDQWGVTSDEPETLKSSYAATAHHLSLVTHHCL
ncbi:MAG TPA: hypothetical protein DCE44_02585 [Verrucomicrobiales bacterium]|nr:hypothetical protein [Verrucomicrobiales bacterium]